MTAVTPGTEMLALADKIRGAIDFSDKFNGIAKMDVKLLNEVEAALRLAAKPAGEGRAEDYHECADIATRYNDCGGNFIAEKIRDAATALSTTGEPKR